MNMRILLIPSWFEYAHKEHTASYVFDQAEILSRIGHEVSMLYLASRPQVWKKDRLETAEIRGVKVFLFHSLYIPKRTKTLIRIWAMGYLKAFEQVRNIIGDIDLIHAHGYIAGFAAHAIFRNFNTAYFLTLHSHKWLTGHFPPGHLRYLKGVIGDATGVFGVSNLLVSRVQERFGNTVHYLPNGVDTSLFKPSERSMPSGTIRIINVGSFIPIKRHELLLSAFHALREMSELELSLELVGSGGNQAKVKDLINTLDLGKEVNMHGSLSRSDLAGLMQNCDLYVCTSKHETFGIALLEAISCDLPVVTVSCGGPDEWLPKEYSTIVRPAEPQELARAILSWIERKKTLQPGLIRQSISETFNLESIASQLVSYYSGKTD